MPAVAEAEEVQQRQGPHPLAPGAGVVHAEHVAGRTAITKLAARSPLKLLAPRQGDDATVYVGSYGGGLLGGDRLSLRVHVGRAATLTLGTQSSTKIYRTHAGVAAAQTLDAHVEEDASLFVLPDPLTPFAGSVYEGLQRISLAPSASLVLVDWVTGGRTARGERWELARYSSHTEIFVGDRVAFTDGLLLDPAHGSLITEHRMGRFNCIATAIVLGHRFAPACAALHGRIRTEQVPRRADTLLVTSPTTGGFAVRAAGVRTDAVTHRLRECLVSLEPTLAGYWSRKW